MLVVTVYYDAGLELLIRLVQLDCFFLCFLFMFEFAFSNNAKYHTHGSLIVFVCGCLIFHNNHTLLLIVLVLFDYLIIHFWKVMGDLLVCFESQFDLFICTESWLRNACS